MMLYYVCDNNQNLKYSPNNFIYCALYRYTYNYVGVAVVVCLYERLS